jgi:hypothetical protein
VSIQPAPWPEPDPQVAAAIKAIYRRKSLPLAVIRKCLSAFAIPSSVICVVGVSVRLQGMIVRRLGCAGRS